MNKLNVSKRACVLFVFCAATAIGTSAQTPTVAPSAPVFTTLHSFDGADGDTPDASLVEGTDGKFYGTTILGGANDAGTVFKITRRGRLSTLHSFDGTDGNLPDALVQGTDGRFYGMTHGGGANGNGACDADGCGTVFSITAGGTLTTLYSFCSQTNCADGANPLGALVQGTDGKFYGTTNIGGAGCLGPNGCGTVFKITPGGKLTTLHSFDGTDGAYPDAGLVQGPDGNFYGTTYRGGANNVCYHGCGTVFSITAGGKLTTLHSFDGTDGANPDAGLVQGSDGNFYGTTLYGGANNDGTIFKFTARDKLTTLHNFCPPTGGVGGCPDGVYPAGLVRGSDGNFYGITGYGGANGDGTFFKLTTGDKLTTLYNFCPPTSTRCGDGQDPYAGLVQGTNGTFYGTAVGGTYGYGTVFSLSVGLGAFVETNPLSGEVGAAVKILGTNLTGATSVTFNGATATFTVKSKSEITTTVPTGATTGTVQVVTPGGTLSSNVPFRVTP